MEFTIQELFYAASLLRSPLRRFRRRFSWHLRRWLRNSALDLLLIFGGAGLIAGVWYLNFGG